MEAKLQKFISIISFILSLVIASQSLADKYIAKCLWIPPGEEDNKNFHLPTEYLIDLKKKVLAEGAANGRLNCPMVAVTDKHYSFKCPGGVATAFGNEFVFGSITYKFSRYNSKMWRLKDIDGQIMTRETCDITEAKQKF